VLVALAELLEAELEQKQVALVVLVEAHLLVLVLVHLVELV
jgi:hypothetical protein